MSGLADIAAKTYSVAPITTLLAVVALTVISLETAFAKTKRYKAKAIAFCLLLGMGLALDNLNRLAP